MTSKIEKISEKTLWHSETKTLLKNRVFERSEQSKKQNTKKVWKTHWKMQ
jgi:hypothetical protein